jgi:putative ABC transport system ATP-binding protein
MSSNGIVVSATDVTRRYGEGEAVVNALQGVSLDVASGTLVAVMGSSGSGKSTLMHLLAALDKPTSGSIRIAGQDVGSLSDREVTMLRREHIGFVFQFFNLLPMLTAEENILLPERIAGERPDEEWLAELLRRAGLEGRCGHRPAELSGGEQQRVAMVRALVSRPTIVFADEPTGNLDSAAGAEILGLMRSSVDAYGQTTLMVTHDANAAAIADRVLFLADGKIVRDLPKPDIAAIVSATQQLT